jgi:hypothetical protein
MAFTAASGGATRSNTGREVIHIHNLSGGPITVTISTPDTVDGLAVAERTVVIADNLIMAIGTFPRYAYGSTVNVSYSGTTSVNVLVESVTPELA